ncbi:hypothetical protein C7W93_09005 [Glaciimonas sp. PCH181]|nr:hypothetical protein C7W93_09005 [Glaciimonas sp. PCH181]
MPIAVVATWREWHAVRRLRMQLIVQDYFSDRRRRKTRFQQLAFWLALTILVVQLIGMAFHDHGVAEESTDCVSCNLAAHFPAPPSLVPIAAVVPVLVFVYYVLPDAAYFFVPQNQRYLIPHPQAPPRVFSRR